MLPMNVPVAQPDRASDFGSEGWGFESLQARHFSAICRRYVALIGNDFGGLRLRRFHWLAVLVCNQLRYHRSTYHPRACATTSDTKRLFKTLITSTWRQCVPSFSRARVTRSTNHS